MTRRRRRHVLVVLAVLAILLARAPQVRASGGGGGNGGGGNGGGSSLLLRVNPAIGEPGGVVAVVLRTYAPRPVSQGQVSIRVVRRPTTTNATKRLGLTLAKLTQPVRPFLTLLSATVYSTQGDSVAQAVLSGLPDSQLTQLKFQSPSGTVNAADGPLAVFLYRLDPSVQPGDVFDLTIDPNPSYFKDETGKTVTLALRSGTLTVRAPGAPYSAEASGTKAQPGTVADVGLSTCEPFGMSGGRVTLTWDPQIAGGPPSVRLDPRYGRSTFTVDDSQPGRLVVEFQSADASFNSVPGTIVAVSLPIAVDAAIGSTSPFSLDPDGTWFLGANGNKLNVALQNGTITIQ
ncbi:MAG TPA: hypothetical protein VIA62_19055 [Thermoanaerobaculia bacterium]|jgi:hypothetical protein|nr:hypothetical protein [Thermoanaerobaculia bacterium]